MADIKLDNGKRIVVKSCLIGEFPEVLRLASAFIDAAMKEEDEPGAAAREIIEKWGPAQMADELTEDDVWAILKAKAGASKAKYLELLPDMAVETMRNFFVRVGSTALADMAAQALTTEGDSTPPGDDSSPESPSLPDNPSEDSTS